MTAMDKVYYDEGLVEVVDAAEVLTSEAVVRVSLKSFPADQNIDTHTATPKSLDFHSSFTLKAESTGSIRALLTYFDTFFSPVPGQTFDSVDLSVLPTGLGNVEPVAPGVVSFTTGPRGKETHWRQVAFLLKTPIELTKGESRPNKLTQATSFEADSTAGNPATTRASWTWRFTTRLAARRGCNFSKSDSGAPYVTA
jgi:protein arginine N-methyltransferase 3